MLHCASYWFFFFDKVISHAFARHISVKLKDDASLKAFCIYSFIHSFFCYQVKLSSSWPLLAVFSIAKVFNWLLSIYLSIYVYISTLATTQSQVIRPGGGAVWNCPAPLISCLLPRCRSAALMLIMEVCSPGVLLWSLFLWSALLLLPLSCLSGRSSFGGDWARCPSRTSI